MNEAFFRKKQVSKSQDLIVHRDYVSTGSIKQATSRPAYKSFSSSSSISLCDVINVQFPSFFKVDEINCTISVDRGDEIKFSENSYCINMHL